MINVQESINSSVVPTIYEILNHVNGSHLARGLNAALTSCSREV